VFQPGGKDVLPVVVDIVSLDLLKGELGIFTGLVPRSTHILNTLLSLATGSTLHFATELIGSTFRIEDNPQVRTPSLSAR
jgi:hypothetical protein